MAATNEFMHHLSMAVCEWFLMFLMYVEAALGFILTKFAHHCELQTPCLFCFRFDRVFGDENSDYYLSHFCNTHRAEVSCLISCDLHHKLSDVKEMCDDCFMSTMKKHQGYPKPLLNKNLVRVPSSSGSCSCCKKQWKPKPRNQIKLGIPKVTMHPPLPLITGRSGARYRRRNCFKKARDKISGTTTPCHVENNNIININNNIHVDVDMEMDTKSDSGCIDIKFSSCSGSDSGDSFYEIECENDGLEDYSRIIVHQIEHSHSVPNLESSLLNRIHNESIIINPPCLLINGSIKHDVKVNGLLEVENETCSINQDLHSDDHHAFNSLNKHDGNDGIDDYESPSTHSVGEIKGESEMEHDHMVSNSSDKHDDYEYSNTHSVGEIKVESEMEDDHMVSNSSDKHDDYEYSNTHSVGEIKNESEMEHDNKVSNSSYKHDDYESLSTHSVGEIKGESEIEKLKRQVEHDQEQLRLLHRELDEERNAAAIAADEAMAMITRLQEEKSALHMEALQYLRMMDEQAEYDMEALDKANDLVNEKDKEIQDLEAELEFFRSQYDDKLIMEHDMVFNNDNFEENHMGNGNIDFVSSNDLKSMNLSELKANNHPVLNFEDEKNYILQSISELERNFHQFSNGDKLLQQNETDMVTVENEISSFNDWLEAVESDREFLEHACNTVLHHVGLEFIQEIAKHLHDLRRVRFDRRCQIAD